MDPISRLNRLIQTLRLRMAESSRRLESSRRGPTTEKSRGTTLPKLALPELRRQIQERIQAAEPNTSEGKRQAKRIFLESVLVWEFGEDLLRDQRYQTMLDRIQATIEVDTELDQQFNALVADLAQR